MNVSGQRTNSPRLKQPFRRLSLAMGFGDVLKPQLSPPETSSSLAAFLTKTKTEFLSDVQQDAAVDAKKWTVVLGNEAGDLDSIASSIAYAWFLSQVEQKPAVPLVQIAKEDLKLRAENLYALDLAGLHAPSDELLTISDVAAQSTSTPHTLAIPPNTTDFFLVDQNRLPPSFSGTVTGIIDHHADEGQHKDTANPRTIVLSGSCSSLVSLALPAQIPPELATLLFTAIVIDTNGLKPGGKATAEDRQAASKLIPISSLSPNAGGGNLTDEALPDAPFVKELNKELSTRKSDLSHLGGWDLLRRDYKEYTHPLPWMAGAPSIKVGLATVPVALKVWGKGGKLEEASLAWMKHRGLTVLGVLTTFNKKKKSGKGKREHKREMAWIVAQVGDEASGSGAVDTAAISKKLWEGIEESKELDVKVHKKFKLEKSKGLPPGAKARAYKQGNTSATRKAVAPLVKAILEAPAPAATASTSQDPAEAKQVEAEPAKL